MRANPKWRELTTARLNEALLGEISWTRFLDLTRLAIDQPTALFFYHDSRDHRGAVTLSSGMEAGTIKSYASHYARINPWLEPTQRFAPGSSLHNRQLLSDDALRATEFYSDFLVPNGYGSSVAVLVNRSKRCNFFFSFLDEDRDEAENAALALELKFLGPQLRRVSDYYMRNRIGALNDPVHRRLSETSGMAVIQIDIMGRVQSANLLGEALLTSGDPVIQRVSGQIRFKNERVTAALNELLTEVHEHAKPIAARTGMDGRYEICFVPQGLDDASSALLGPSIAILITANLSLALAESYGLSPAEIRVTCDLINGLKPKEIATMRNLSVDTIRSQLKSIFLKTGVKSQNELLLLAANLKMKSGTP